MKTANRYQEGDRLLPIEKARAELEAKLGNGWSRQSIKRKIREGCPFSWKSGLHFIQIGNKLAAINVDAIFRELIN